MPGWLRSGRKLRKLLRVAALLGAGASSLTCADPLDLCTPKKARFDFFSKGDCMLTRASFFQGHEWLTWFGNRDLPADDRFTDAEISTIVEGNRRVDWPKELLFHMNNGILAYISALTEHTEEPKNQRLHFLLTDKNSTAEAAAEAQAEVRRLTVEAMRAWITNRIWSLTLMGKAQHLIQDAYSEAHSRREPLHPTRPFCVLKVKAFIERAPGYDTPDIEYHSDDDDASIGHTTTKDSIYRTGRDCHEPVGAAAVEGCLSESALRARVASADHLRVLRRLIGNQVFNGAALEQAVDAELEPFIAKHLALCP